MGASGKKRRQKSGSMGLAVGQESKKVRTHDWDKDQEEIDLEARLFGTSKRTAGSGKSDEDDGRLGGLDDSELFTVDAPVMGLVSEDESEDDVPREIDQEKETDDEDDEIDYEQDFEASSDQESDDQGSESDASSSSQGSGASIRFHDESEPSATVTKAKKKKGEEIEPTLEFPEDLQDELPARNIGGVWNDPADNVVRVDLEASRILKKLGRGKGDPNINGIELEKRLREQFESLHPRPEWASGRIASGTPSVRLLLSSTKSFIAPTKDKRAPLPSGNLELQRLLNANHQSPTTSRRQNSGGAKGVVDVAWHPNPKVGVMAVAGSDRRVRFFNIDGHTNPSLLTIHLPALPLTKSTFHPSGSSVLLAGTRPYYYTYDLFSARCIRSPRNLFGSVFTPSTPNSLTRHAFSPDGTMLAVAGRRGAVSILDWSGIGVGAVIAELKSGRGAAVVDLSWSRDSKELSVLGGRDGAEVEVWNVGERKVSRKWRDDRAFGGTIMKTSRGGEYTAIGSSTGIVNLYSSSSLSSPTADASESLLPTPIKSLEHLTTPIVSEAFHPSGEMLVTASNARKNQLKVYHLPTGNAFPNWPTMTTPLGRVTNVSFSSGGEYMAAGNERGLVLLYSVKHYAQA